MIKYDIICAGEMLIDFSPTDKKNTYTANPGGAPSNVAISAARNNLSVAFYGILGNDDFGKMLKDTLEENDVTLLSSELTEKAVTTLAFVTLYENGERSFTFARKPGADMLLDKKDIKISDIDSCKLFHAGSFSLSSNPSRDAIKYALKLAHSKNKLVSFDINYRDMVWDSIDDCKKHVYDILPFVDILKISDEELFFVKSKENIYNFMDKFNITVVIQTLGKDGAIYYFNKTSKMIPARKTKCIDATGAGDAFFGGFLSRLLMKNVVTVSDITCDILTDALNYGNISASICVEKMGGIPSIPNKKTIEKLIF